MKLLVVIVDAHHRNDLRKMLAENAFGATLLESQGGFLGRGSSTILMAVDEARVDEAVARVKEVVHPVELTGKDGEKTVVSTSVFVCPMERFEKR